MDERTPMYTLRVEEIDGGTPPVSTATTVIVTIADVNAPRFDESTYEVRVTENSATGVAVTVVHAGDADSDDNGRVVWCVGVNQSRQSIE